MTFSTSSVPPSDPSHANGKLSPARQMNEAREVTSDSDSDLSEPLDLPNGPAQFLNGEEEKVANNQDEGLSGTESSPDEDALGSDDPDYDLATPSRPKHGSNDDARSSSQESPRYRKRKSGVEHGDFMLNDPELYGLRRSVSSPPLTPR